MRPYVLHLFILAALMIPGGGLLIMKMMSSQSGGLLFRKYDATKLYWPVISTTSGIIYAAMTSLPEDTLLKVRDEQKGKKVNNTFVEGWN